MMIITAYDVYKALEDESKIVTIYDDLLEKDSDLAIFISGCIAANTILQHVKIEDNKEYIAQKNYDNAWMKVLLATKDLVEASKFVVWNDDLALASKLLEPLGFNMENPTKEDFITFMKTHLEYLENEMQELQ